MQKKQKLIHAALFFLGGLIFFAAFLFIYTRLFEERWPYWQEYTFFLINLFLLSLFVFFKNSGQSSE